MFAFFLPLLSLALVSNLWILAQPGRYVFQSSLPLDDQLLLVLLLFLPLVLASVLVLLLPRLLSRLALVVTASGYFFLIHCLTRAEGWLGSIGRDLILETPWGSLFLRRTPEELYVLGRSLLLERHPWILSSQTDWLQQQLVLAARDFSRLDQFLVRLDSLSGEISIGLSTFLLSEPISMLPALVNLCTLFALALVPGYIPLPGFEWFLIANGRPFCVGGIRDLKLLFCSLAVLHYYLDPSTTVGFLAKLGFHFPAGMMNSLVPLHLAPALPPKG